jgi:ABC-type nickel/cobalt efflux system permease component RcnA
MPASSPLFPIHINFLRVICCLLARNDMGCNFNEAFELTSVTISGDESRPRGQSHLGTTWSDATWTLGVINHAFPSSWLMTILAKPVFEVQTALSVGIEVLRSLIHPRCSCSSPTAIISRSLTLFFQLLAFLDPLHHYAHTHPHTYTITHTHAHTHNPVQLPARTGNYARKRDFRFERHFQES